jgi:hypothetical protein
MALTDTLCLLWPFYPAQLNVTALDGPTSMEIGSGKMLAGAIDRLAMLLQPLGVDPTYLQAISAKLMGGIGKLEWSAAQHSLGAAACS